MEEKNESRTGRKSPPGRGKTGISAGKVLDHLVQFFESQPDFDKSTSPIYRPDFYRYGWQQYIPRAFLTPEQSVQILSTYGTTLHELFRTVLNTPELTEEEQAALSGINSMSRQELVSLLETIRELQYPWWPALFEEPIHPIGVRLNEITRRRVGYIGADRASSKQYPAISSYFPFKKQRFISTDDIPLVAQELDVPYPALSELGFSVPNYTKNEFADIVFCEYKMLSRSLRPIVEDCITLLSREEAIV